MMGARAMRWAFHLAATGAMLLVGSEALGQTSDIHERDDKFRPYREVFTVDTAPAPTPT